MWMVVGRGKKMRKAREIGVDDCGYGKRKNSEKKSNGAGVCPLVLWMK